MDPIQDWLSSIKTPFTDKLSKVAADIREAEQEERRAEALIEARQDAYWEQVGYEVDAAGTFKG